MPDIPRSSPQWPEAQITDIRFSERLQSLVPPKELPSEDFDTVLEFVGRGGRLRAIDYTKIPPEEKKDGFRKARQYLNDPLFSVVNGLPVFDALRAYHHPNPNNPDGEKFAPIYPLPREMVDAVMDTVIYREPHPEWDGQEHFERRRHVLDRFVASVYLDRPTYAALMALCQGKTGPEVLKDMQEQFDHWREYREARDVTAFNELLLRSNGDTRLGYRPFEGILGVWQPFNFNCIGIGDTAAALLMSNTIVIHTSARNVGTYKWLYDRLLDAGVPPESVQFIVPHDDPDDYAKVDTAMSEELAAHPALHVIQFTGSHKVAKLLHAAQAKKVQGGAEWLDYRLQAEASGYNPFVIGGVPRGALDPLRSFLVMGGHENDEPTKEAWDQFFADLERDGGALKNFLRAVVDSITGLQSHKCSSLKEFVVAVDETGEMGLCPMDAAMLKLLIAERLKRVTIGPVEDGGVDMGSLIDRKMHRDVRQKLERIVAEGGELLTGESIDDIMHVEGLPNAMRVAFYQVPDGDLASMDAVEIFAPVVRWKEVRGV
ncbi:aldehyde dehydrogenase family protein, partial [Candidatus Peregrinibacteria bacterium]|nr:aldehyde dehydrogenase family protein [Candidatus Peregrinibacteria bacterium]